jgi:hypothetical protein
VDARLYHLQGKAELVTPGDLRKLLQEFYRDKLSLRNRRAAAARLISSYEINNTYQYEGKGTDAERALFTEDRDLSRQFVERWRDRVDRVTHARHRGMLRVILGETLEQQRFFDHALAGREDLLGRRPDGVGTGGGVLPARWME